MSEAEDRFRSKVVKMSSEATGEGAVLRVDLAAGGAGTWHDLYNGGVVRCNAVVPRVPPSEGACDG